MDTLSLLLSPPHLDTDTETLLQLYLRPAQRTEPDPKALQALRGAGKVSVQTLQLTPFGSAAAEEALALLRPWAEDLFAACLREGLEPALTPWSSGQPSRAPSKPQPETQPDAGRSRNAAVRAYVRRCRRVRLSAVLSELKLEGCRAAVKEYIRRDPSLTWEGRGAEAFVCWVGATDNLLRLDRQGAHAPYNPKRVMDTLQAALSPCRGFLAFLPGVAYDGDDQPHPVLNVQYEDPKTETDKEDPWFLVTHENLQAALEGILLGAARVFELRQVKRDLRAWLQDESAAPVGVEAWLYVWQSLVHGQVIHKAVDRRRV